MILLVVWYANGDGSALSSKACSNLLNDDTYRCVCAGIIVSSIRTNRARCALYEILDLLDKESISGESSGTSLKIQQEVLPQMFEKVSRSLKYDSKKNLVHKHTYNMDTNTDYFNPLTLCMWGNYHISHSCMIYNQRHRIFFSIRRHPLFVPDRVTSC